MKYKLIIPFHWYSGESHTPPPYLKRYFDTLEEAKKWKWRCDRVYKLREKRELDLALGRRLPKESAERFREELDNYFGLRADGFIDGLAEIYEVSEIRVK